MKRNQLLYFVLAMFLLMSGIVASCSDDKDPADNYVTYYDGTYSGRTLEAVVDGQIVDGMTVSIKVSGEQAKIHVNGYPSASRELSWTTECKTDISVQPQMHGEYISPDGEKYEYEISMSGMYGKAHCKLVCQRVQK